MNHVTYISVSLPERGRPAGRPPKTNWKIEMIKKGLKALQHTSPRRVADVVWHYFTKPGKVFFSEPQKKLTERAELGEMTYRGDKIKTYKWGIEGPRILLCHGWRSKSADFRRMIEAFLESGYTVEAVDNRAHGNSEGEHTAMPEYREILREYMLQHEPFDIAIGYSMGGAALGVAVSELPDVQKPRQLFFIAAPPYISYFFEDLLKEIGLKKTVYQALAKKLKSEYGYPVEYFDLRQKTDQLSGIEKHFIYCEDDETILFSKGMELYESFKKDGHFVQARGFGHYKIISTEKIIHYLLRQLKPQVGELTVS